MAVTALYFLRKLTKQNPPRPFGRGKNLREKGEGYETAIGFNPRGLSAGVRTPGFPEADLIIAKKG